MHEGTVETLDSAASPMIPQPFVIRNIRRETEDTFTMELEPETSGVLCSFAPGQFNMVYVYGVGEIPISISGDPGNTHSVVHTTRAVGTVTKVMDKLKKGDFVGIRGPYGVPWPLQEAVGKDVVIVAGGIGLAPLRPALYSILKEREKYGKVVLLYGTRTPSDILFREELERWRSRFDLDVFVSVDRAVSGWKGNVGVVTNLISKSPFDPHNSLSMICGPEVMIRFTVMELIRRGVDPSQLFISMERNMKCGVGLCGHCQFGHYFVCEDGPVFRYTDIKDMLVKWEI